MHLEGIHSLTQIKPSKPLTKSLKTQKQETKIEKKKVADLMTKEKDILHKEAN
jgi:uncharacterized protein (UPF0254 family)